MNPMLETIDMNPVGSEANASVIWLHGLGADGEDFVPIVQQFNLAPARVRFVFPHALVRPITVNGGAHMRGWYDIISFDFPKPEDLTGIQGSATLINALIEREKSLGIPSHSIVLAGFSQGGAMALHTGLRYPEPLGGIISLSAYLPLADLVSEERHISNQKTPIFMAHGSSDSIVPLMLGELSRHHLLNLGYSIDWHSYAMPHTVIPEEIQDIGRFLRKIFSNN